MPLTFNDVTTASSITSSATLVATGVSVAVGDWIIVGIAADNSGSGGAASLTGVTDSAGNTYQQLSQITQDPGAADAGITLGIYLAQVTSALSSGSVTANFSPNTTSKVMSVKRITPGAGEVVGFVSAGPGVVGSGTSNLTAGAVAMTSGQVMYGAFAIEASAQFVSNNSGSGWSAAQTVIASTGSQPTSAGLITQQYTEASSSTQNFSVSSNFARDYAMNYVILFPALPSLTGYWSINGVTM